MGFAGQIEGDLVVRGTLSATTTALSTECVTDVNVSGSAGIQAGKLEHQYVVGYAQESATDAADEARVIHVVYGATGTIVGFSAGSVAKATGDDTCTVDLKKNGTTVLAAVITLDSANTNYVAEAGTISSAAVVSGDVLEVVINATHNTGTLPTGIFATAIIREAGA